LKLRLPFGPSQLFGGQVTPLRVVTTPANWPAANLLWVLEEVSITSIAWLERSDRVYAWSSGLTKLISNELSGTPVIVTVVFSENAGGDEKPPPAIARPGAASSVAATAR
jgi:hypothetical protein